MDIMRFLIKFEFKISGRDLLKALMVGYGKGLLFNLRLRWTLTLIWMNSQGLGVSSIGKLKWIDACFDEKTMTH